MSTALSEAELDPANLELEITERAFVQDTEESRAIIKSLRALGVSLTVDDFGTGQASIAYLQRYPFEKLKIDRSYVSNLASDDQDRAMASAILSLAQALEIRVVGEGIETEEQAIWLRHKGCDFGQGYLFGRALTRSEFLKFPEKMNERSSIEQARRRPGDRVANPRR